MRRRLATTPYPVLFVLFALVLAPPAFSGVAPPSPHSSATAVLSGLPIKAQARISAVLGRDQRAYHARREGEAIHLNNPRHGLKAVLTAKGVEIESGGTRFQVRLRGVGRGARLEALAPAEPEAVANRIEYERGGLAEWYVNGPLGLEQGFTLENPPGPATGEALTVALDLGGELNASPASEGVAFLHADGTAALDYRGLAAWDATGRTLPAWWQHDGSEVRLRVDDTGARYPVTIDPFMQQAKLTASDGAENDAFGSAVAVGGDTVVVGAAGGNNPASPGSAYVFVAPPGGFPGALTETARLTASDGAAGDQFGSSVAISGDTVVVGALGANAFQGSAYVFVAPSGGFAGVLTETAKLTASDGVAEALFGFSVAISGDTVVVGASGTNAFQGLAYAFVAPAGGFAGVLNETAKLTASDGAEMDSFGSSVAISGDTVVLGAPGAIALQGSAYVFAPPGGFAGVLIETAKLSASDGAESDSFGSSVAINGDTVVVGAPGVNVFQGSAYVFAPPGGFAGELMENTKLTASDGSEGDELGFSVAVSGDTVVVGARAHDSDAGNEDQGQVYITVLPSTGQLMLRASDGVAGDQFGSSVAISGDIFVAGAPGANATRGSAYVFVRPAAPPPGTPPPLPVDCRGVTATIVGTDGDDGLPGTAGPDVIAGLGGNDTIQGLGGNDRLCGGPGNDTITGGSGRDRLLGEQGRDRLHGGRGRDVLEGGPGNDTLDGGRGRDTCKGGRGRDSVRSCEAGTR